MDGEFVPRRAIAPLAVDVCGVALAVLMTIAAGVLFRAGETMSALVACVAAGGAGVFVLRLVRAIRDGGRWSKLAEEHQRFMRRMEGSVASGSADAGQAKGAPFQPSQEAPSARAALVHQRGHVRYVRLLPAAVIVVVLLAAAFAAGAYIRGGQSRTAPTTSGSAPPPPPASGAAALPEAGTSGRTYTEVEYDDELAAELDCEPEAMLVPGYQADVPFWIYGNVVFRQAVQRVMFRKSFNGERWVQAAADVPHGQTTRWLAQWSPTNDAVAVSWQSQRLEGSPLPSGPGAGGSDIEEARTRLVRMCAACISRFPSHDSALLSVDRRGAMFTVYRQPLRFPPPLPRPEASGN